MKYQKLLSFKHCSLSIVMLLAGMIVSLPAEAAKKKKKDKEVAAAPAKKPEPKPSVVRNGLFKVTKINQDWFFEVGDSLIGREFLTTTRYTSTPASSGKFGGEQVNEQTVYWEVTPDSQLVLRAKLLINAADSSQSINKAITISNENPIIGAFKVESHKNKAYKIKVNSFFNEDNPAVGLPENIKKGYGLAAPVATASYIEDIKSFPLNTEIRLVKTWKTGPTSTLPTARYTGKATFGLNISFIMLPEKPMMKRYYDPRVGYFADSYNEFTDEQQRVQSKRFIVRYRLEPKPEDVEKMKRGELVEPQKPIVYYIDPATPKQWRPYLIKGVNDWQKAFEKAGFKNAIIGKEWPENDSTMSMEDARYCVIRYLASPIENAYGPNVHDPRTGEILESHICWYHNVMSLLHDWYMIQASSIDEAAQKMNFDEELMGELIRFVSSHEVGHSLGLRHNFGASSTVPVDSLRNKQWVEIYGHTPSIMDYARFNYVAQPEDGISRKGIFPRINDYDIWAIQWGYTPMIGATDEDSDRLMLEKLVEKNLNGNKRLWWGDGEGYRNDPRCLTEDLGDDAMKASEYGIKNLKRMLQNLPKWTYDKKDYYNANLSKMYSQVLNQFNRYNGHVIGQIGGMMRDFKTIDQQGDVFTAQPKAKQKAAMAFLDRNVFNEPAWLIDNEYMMRLTNDPQEFASTIGTTAVVRLMTKIRNNDLNKEYTADELLTDMTRMLFKEAGTGRKVSDYRAKLQTTFVSQLISAYEASMATTASRPYVLRTLKQLKQRTASAMNSGDSATKAHYANLNDVISRALEVK